MVFVVAVNRVDTTDKVRRNDVVLQITRPAQRTADIVGNASTLLCLLDLAVDLRLSRGNLRFLGFDLDAWCGILVATFILYSGIKSTSETLSPLLGNPPDEEFVEQIETIVLSYDEIVNIHDLVVHDYGPGRCMISLHAEVPGNGDIFALHDAVDRAEIELAKKLGCMATIHMDPISVDDEKVASMRLQLALYASELGEGITVHDFRIVEGPTHTNVIFDAVLPYSVKMTPDELKEKLNDFIHNTWKNHNAVITIDRPYHNT